jgi:hypothetical protein
MDPVLLGARIVTKRQAALSIAVLIGTAILASGIEPTISGSAAAQAQAALPVPATSVVPQDNCSTLGGFQSADVKITDAETLPVGAAITGAVGVAPNLPAFCRVVGHIHPEPGSDIGFEVWMPSQHWDGRLNGAGNGGFAGPIAYRDLAAAVQAGQAGVSTDTGHKGSASKVRGPRATPSAFAITVGELSTCQQ